MISDERVIESLSCGIPLHDFGTHNWALTREQALQAIGELELMNVPILGGDVVEIDKGKIEFNYDNWHCDLNDGELKRAYVSRSAICARHYIVEYDDTKSSRAHFVLVPGD
ncbi:MAG: hypothetical protein JJ900_16190 [Rhodospirillales bacterium]|nr:hypothetical protein [Rhodospirillales bacterium]MBO6788389.1 hypothetical protein [Rhodospirillales bacterium]